MEIRKTYLRGRAAANRETSIVARLGAVVRVTGELLAGG